MFSAFIPSSYMYCIFQMLSYVYRDDPDLDKMLKERVRWGDPMAHLVKVISEVQYVVSRIT